MKNLLLILLMLCGLGSLRAQQQPLNTQYMFNGLVINPAYAGSHRALSTTVHARHQWTGVEGAPRTQTFSTHAPFKEYKIGLGLVVGHDRHSIFEENSIHTSYAYRIKMKDGFFAMGLQTSLIQFRSNLTEALALDPGDPLFSTDIQNNAFNFGTGLYYFTDKYYWGISVPQILESKISDLDDTQINARKERLYFLSGGLIFDLNPEVKMRTQGLLKLVRNGPIQLEANVSTIHKDVLWLGLSWRSFADASAFMQFQVNDHFRVGYAYDFPTSSEIRSVSGGSHELMINYKIKIKKQKICKTYF